MERQIERLRAKYAGDAEALAGLDEVPRNPRCIAEAGTTTATTSSSHDESDPRSALDSYACQSPRSRSSG
jgi:hypothetical protein